MLHKLNHINFCYKKWNRININFLYFLGKQIRFIPRFSRLVNINYIPNLTELTFSNKHLFKGPILSYALYMYHFYIDSVLLGKKNWIHDHCLSGFCKSKTSDNLVYKITCINVNVIFLTWLVFLIYVEFLPPPTNHIKKKVHADFFWIGHIFS